MQPTIIDNISNSSVVKVNSKGVMKPLKSGKAVITVTSVSNSKVSKKIKVTVKTPIKKIKLNEKNLTLKEGEEFYIKATVSPTQADKMFKYKSSKPSVATISKTGKIKAKKAGITKITKHFSTEFLQT